MALEGAENLRRAFKELGDMTSTQARSTLRAMVAVPAKMVAAQARLNIRSFSPGKAQTHRTYLGNVVSAGFASQNIGVKTKISPKKGKAEARIGVAKEAFYAVSFFELGVPSRGIAKHPWLVPALESQQDKIVSTSGEAVLKRIKAIVKKRAKSFAAKGIR